MKIFTDAKRMIAYAPDLQPSDIKGMITDDHTDGNR